jgi:tetratricopeptide (TPR) repeat protein
MSISRRSSVLLGAVSMLAMLGGALGCQEKQVPDPNDPTDVPLAKRAAVLQLNIQRMSDAMNDRVVSGNITDQQRLDYISDEAQKLLAQGDPEHSTPQDAWIYANLYITCHEYAKAIPLLKKAIQYEASVGDDDRRVNDSLRLARSLAETGKTKEALDLVQSVIDSKPKDPGPVLPSVLLEITPVTEGKGHDPQLSHLLEEAIHEHLRMKVDPSTLAGKTFLFAKPHHIWNAWLKIESLDENSGHPDQAAAARERAKAMMQTLDSPPVQS